MAGARYEPEKCTFCRNTGKVTSILGLDTKICPACDGQGSVLVVQPARRCDYCRGQGRIERFFQIWPKQCKVCRGTGWAHVVKLKSR